MSDQRAVIQGLRELKKASEGYDGSEPIGGGNSPLLDFASALVEKSGLLLDAAERGLEAEAELKAAQEAARANLDTILAAVCSAPHGGKTYQTDDVAYLATLAERMRHGFYGINPTWMFQQAQLVHHTLSRITELEEQLSKVMKAATAELIAREAQIAAIRAKLSEIVCTEGCDAGVVMLSQDGPTHPETHGGRTIQVYDHEYFSPLGDALMEAWKMAGGEE
jgi:hypothetical protein